MHPRDGHSFTCGVMTGPASSVDGRTLRAGRGWGHRTCLEGLSLRSRTASVKNVRLIFETGRFTSNNT